MIPRMHAMPATLGLSLSTLEYRLGLALSRSLPAMLSRHGSLVLAIELSLMTMLIMATMLEYLMVVIADLDGSAGPAASAAIGFAMLAIAGAAVSRSFIRTRDPTKGIRPLHQAPGEPGCA